MTMTLLSWSILVAQLLLGLAMACAAFRLLRGPRAQDRVLGLDTLYVNSTILLLTFGIRTGSTVYFDSAVIIALLGFVATAALVLTGAGLTLTGSLGLLRLGNFYDRIHAPTLGTTLGIGCVLLASMLFFSVLQTRPVLHELLIAGFMIVTTPVTLMLLARAALYRDRSEGSPGVPSLPRSQQAHSDAGDLDPPNDGDRPAGRG